jgi:hypothetical protein
MVTSISSIGKTNTNVDYISSVSRDEGRLGMNMVDLPHGYHSPRSLYLLDPLSEVLPSGVHLTKAMVAEALGTCLS